MVRKAFLVVAILPLLFPACSSDPEPKGGTNNGNCVGAACADGGAPDAGSEASDQGGISDQGAPDTGPIDPGTCASGCTEPLICNSATGTCVECVSNAECGDNGSCNADTNTCECAGGFQECGGACVAADTPDACGESCTVCPSDPNGTRTCSDGVCGLTCAGGLLEVGGRCVECASNAECDSPTASACSDGSCGACADNSDCAHISGRNTCADGACVECTATDESACGNNSCDPFNGTCTSTPRGSQTVCEPCVADSECALDHACVPMNFGPDLRSSSFCLREDTDGCSGVYGTSVNRTTASGATGNFCTINEDLTTCEAVLDYNAPCGDASDCGAVGLDDGLCEPIDFDRAGCTYLCNALSECPSASITGCATGNLNGEKWCGAY